MNKNKVMKPTKTAFDGIAMDYDSMAVLGAAIEIGRAHV